MLGNPFKDHLILVLNPQTLPYKSDLRGRFYVRIIYMVDIHRKVLVQNFNTQANLEILQKHVAKLEERISLLEVKSFEGSEDYYCWILLNSLLVSNKLERLRLINDLSGDRIDKKRKEITF